MLESYKLYKNDRGRFISLEQNKGWPHYKAYMISKSGKHRFIKFIDIGDEASFITKLKLVEASQVEYALNALYRASPELEANDLHSLY